MATDSNKKLTRYTSAVTVVTADVMNALYGGEYAHNLSLYAEDQYHPLVAGHIHDGDHADGHASKVLLTQGAHVRGTLSHANLGGTGGTTPAVNKDNIQCYPEDQYGPHGEGFAIPVYDVDPDTGEKCYYLDLSTMIGGDDTHVQYNEGGHLGGSPTFVFDYNQHRVGIGVSSPDAKLAIGSYDNTDTLILRESDESIYGPDAYFDKSRSGDTVQDGDYLGTIVARGWDGDSYGKAGGIQFRVDGIPSDGDVSSELRLVTRPSGPGGINWSTHTRVIIKSDGNVGIGTETPTNRFEVVGGDSSFCGGKVKLYGEPQLASPSGCPVNDMVAFFDGDIDVTGCIDPIGIIFSEVNPNGDADQHQPGVPTGPGKGAIFVAIAGSVDENGAALEENKLYYKDKDGKIVKLGKGGEPSQPPGSIQYNKGGQFSGDDSIRIDSKLNLGIGVSSNAGEPKRKLHVKDTSGVPPVRINDLPRGTGANVVWDEKTGDLFHEPPRKHPVEPRIKTWPQDGGDIVLDTEDIGAMIIVAGVWDGRSRVVIPHFPPLPDWRDPTLGEEPTPPVPPDPGPYYTSDGATTNATSDGATTNATLDTPEGNPQLGEFETGDNFWIKNMSIYLGKVSNAGIKTRSTAASYSTNAYHHVTPAMAVYSEDEYTFELMEASVDSLNIKDTFFRTTGDIRVFSDATDAFDSEGIYKVATLDSVNVSVDSLGSNRMFYASTNTYISNVSASVDSFGLNASADSLDTNGALYATTNTSYTTGGGHIDAQYRPLPEVTHNRQLYVPIPIVSDNSMDTLDGEPLFRGYILPPKNTVQVCCITDKNDKMKTRVNHWFIMSNYCPCDNMDMPPIADIKVFNGDTPVYNGEIVEMGAVLTFDGRGSYDHDGDVIDEYMWTLFINGEELGVMSKPVFTIDTSDRIFAKMLNIDLDVSLVVRANNAYSVPADFSCYIENTNSAPIASFTVDPYTVVGTEVSLDATGSSDPDGDSIEYVWSFVSQPQGSYISLDDLSSSTGVFIPDAEGTYEISLVVNDGQLDSVAAINTTYCMPNQPPEVVVLGDNPKIIRQTPSYGEYGEAEDALNGLPDYDMGAYAVDPEGGSVDIMISGLPIDTSTSSLGNEVIYTATDSVGNSEIGIRIVDVIPDDPAIITVYGAQIVEITVGDTYGAAEDALHGPGESPYYDKGAYAVDDVDGVYTSDQIMIEGLPVNTSTEGESQVIYSVTDSFGNVTTASRTVRCLANNKPVITPNPPLDVPDIIAGADVSYVDAGATAIDSEDGDLTPSIDTLNPVDTTTPGTYTVRYNVTDSHGQAADEVTREVTVVPANVAVNIADIQSYPDSPVISDQIHFTAFVWDQDYDDTITYEWLMTDQPAGSLAELTPVGAQEMTGTSGTVEAFLTPDAEGDYTVKLTASDGINTGAVAVKTIAVARPQPSHFVVSIADTGVSSLAILLDSITLLEPGDEVGLFDRNGVLYPTDTNPEYGEVLVGSGVWTGNQLEVVGIMSYDFSDFSGPISAGAVEGNLMVLKVWKTSEQVEYTVVPDIETGSGTFDKLFTAFSELAINERPIITITGASSVSVSQHDSYMDEGATADDGEGNDITERIVTTNNVDTSTPGVYIVTYNVEDPQGGSADEGKREVTVIEANQTPTASLYISAGAPGGEPVMSGDPDSIVYYLNGLGSDPDGDQIVSYSFYSVPADSGTPTLLNPGSLSTPLLGIGSGESLGAGVHEYGLVVNDGESDSSMATVTLTINGTPPDSTPNWEDDPGAYELTATIAVGVVNPSMNEGSGFAEEGDLFAAFDEDGKVRGVATQLIAPFGPYAGSIIYEMQLRSNSEGDTLFFKYYDASESLIFDVSQTYQFVANDILGNLYEPELYNTSGTGSQIVMGNQNTAVPNIIISNVAGDESG